MSIILLLVAFAVAITVAVVGAMKPWKTLRQSDGRPL